MSNEVLGHKIKRSCDPYLFTAPKAVSGDLARSTVSPAFVYDFDLRFGPAQLSISLANCLTRLVRCGARLRWGWQTRRRASYTLPPNDTKSSISRMSNQLETSSRFGAILAWYSLKNWRDSKSDGPRRS